MFEIKNIIKSDSIISEILPLLKDKEAYLVGGYVRDAIINGRSSYDRDIIINSPKVRDITEEIAQKLNLFFVPLDEENKIYRLIFPDKVNYIDIAAVLNGNFAEDIRRRDLTINAIAYDLNKNELIDLVNGKNDIEQKIIRGISEKNFFDDPLRLLRALRFMSKMGFEIEENLFNLIKDNYKLLAKPSKERINVELMKIFEGEYCSSTLLKLDEAKILEFLFPYISEIKKIPPNSHHHLDLFHHSLETVSQIENFYSNANDEIKKYLEQIDFGVTSRLSHLKFAGFFHDIGKPSTWSIEEGTLRHRFIKHDDAGSKLIVPILKEFKFSKKQITYIQNIIKYHIYPSMLVQDEARNEKTTFRFFRKTEGYTIDLIIIAIADRLSARGVDITEEIVQNNINGLNTLLTLYQQSKEAIKPLPKLLDGFEIMEILNLRQGKELGKIIDKLKEAQISGEITTKEEAIEFITLLK